MTIKEARSEAIGDVVLIAGLNNNKEAAHIIDEQFLVISKEDAKELLPKLFNTWLKETKRSGGVLIGASIREFIDYFLDNLK
jgi:hypothetical protein